MRIALVAALVSPVADPPEGGASSLLADLAPGLAGRGHEVTLYAAQGSAVAGARVVDLGIQSEPLREALWRSGQQQGVESAAMEAAFARVYEHAAAQDYDVVHNHAFDVPSVRHAASLAVPVVHSLHLAPRLDMAAALDAARTRSRVCVATVSEQQRIAWSAHVQVDAVLRNGVPTTRIPWSAQPGHGALIAGRCSPEKGIAEGIAAARAAGLRVDVYGSRYDETYARNIERQWSRDPLVRLHAAVPRARILEAMREAAVVCCISQGDEAGSMVVAEAQATGTPVVASERGGNPELMVDGVTGVLVPHDDPAAAVLAVRRAVGLDRTACRRHAEQHLEMDSAVGRHESLYAALRDSRPPRENASP